MWRQRILIGEDFLTKNWVMSAEATSCDAMVAQAAPSIPQWNFMMKR